MYDLIVIGAGPGGYVAAIRAAQLGLKVACVEKRASLGGTCLNVGCIPSKTLLHSSEWFWHLQKEGAHQGIHTSSLSYDWKTMQARKETVVTQLTKGIEGLFKKNKVDWIQGHGSLKGPHTVSVNNQSFEAKSIVLATGSEPISLPFLPFDEKQFFLPQALSLSPLSLKNFLL
jgi:Pyruvate/2-oxoglutarate dehydrogenase complex, dihydrolipoamide dehydrogenase (E3) component, and related enzymes